VKENRNKMLFLRRSTYSSYRQSRPFSCSYYYDKPYFSPMGACLLTGFCFNWLMYGRMNGEINYHAEKYEKMEKTLKEIKEKLDKIEGGDVKKSM